MAQPLETVIGGKYEILQKIGEGGMGSIYKVRHRLLDEIRIVKVLRSQLAMDETLQQRFQNEARTAIHLRHPNIAHLFDFSVSDEGRVAFIVMEFIDGVTLQELIAQSGAPTPGLAVEIAAQFAKALSYLHSQGFVHRDIASDNLMLTTDFEGSPLVKLIDLGIAKSADQNVDLTATGIFMGKARYSPPEMFDSDGGASALDERSDIYSFGVLLYELFTGQSPFAGDSFSEIVAGHLFRAPMPFEESDPDGNVPEELRRLTLRALEKEPAKRVDSAAEIAELLAVHAVSMDDHRSEFRRALEATSHIQTIEAAPADDGSTQNRLDREFGVGDPSSHNDESRAVRLEAISHAALAIRERTQLGEVTTAEKDLELAVSLYGDHPEFEDLRGQLQEASDGHKSGADAPPTSVTGELTTVSGIKKPRLGRATSPIVLALIAGTLLLAVGGLWLATRPEAPAPAGGLGLERSGAAIYVQPAPRWGTISALPNGEFALAEELAVEAPPPRRRQAPPNRSRPGWHRPGRLQNRPLRPKPLSSAQPLPRPHRRRTRRPTPELAPPNRR